MYVDTAVLIQAGAPLRRRSAILQSPDLSNGERDISLPAIIAAEKEYGACPLIKTVTITADYNLLVKPQPGDGVMMGRKNLILSWEKMKKF